MHTLEALKVFSAFDWAWVASAEGQAAVAQQPELSAHSAPAVVVMRSDKFSRGRGGRACLGRPADCFSRGEGRLDLTG